MMSFEKPALGTLAFALVTVALACSNESEDAANAKQGSEAACDRINEVCASVQGFQRRDCAGANAAYDRLTASEKAQADAIIPCVIAATSCEPALACVRPPSDSAARGNGKAAPAHEARAVCEHINDVCKSEAGFKTQNCSGSNADYDGLSDADKEVADGIAACIMDAKSCSSAFKCLEFN